MPLSDHEQRMLEELERQLSVDDPRLARTFRQSGAPRRDRRRIMLGIAGVIVGLGLLITGVAMSAIWLGAVAFALMVAGGIWAVTAPVRSARPTAPGAPAPTAHPSSAGGSSPFMRRMEQRWDRRSETDGRD